MFIAVKRKQISQVLEDMHKQSKQNHSPIDLQNSEQFDQCRLMRILKHFCNFRAIESSP